MYKYIIKHYLLKNIVKSEKGIITDFETCNLKTFTKKTNKQTKKKINNHIILIKTNIIESRCTLPPKEEINFFEVFHRQI